MRKTVGVLTAAMLGLVTSMTIAAPASAAPSLRVHSVQYHPNGVNDGSGTFANREWLQLVNRGKEAVNLRGYTVHNKNGRTYRFGDVVIPGKGGRVWLRSGAGDDTARTVYWNTAGFVWDVEGDKAFLRNRKGHAVHTCSWSYVKGRDWVRCPVNP
ncbi:lamin tail domain-containing protein [Solwaraspora sp. WMMA2080]|uniref:lamin tail domain-containing protein n=2 Tax=Solwaraspora TaxID=265431 RepID=UPI00248ACBD9|nr:MULTISPECIES: lamin tail domain-containing protein [unclassified Solwaraspora]WBB97565.1 lamin tail domain-containing protein [Solwaraspora sp. WMMA2059]WBC18542.1 lamin tail domain-containing protein [Solwaraspora sp. WMMA2080]